MRTLLKLVKNIWVKRLFLCLSELHRLPWFKYLDRRGARLGRGRRALVKHGRLDRKYRNTVPVDLEKLESGENMVSLTRARLLSLQKALKTDAAIGKKFGITRQAVQQHRAKYGIPCVPDRYKERNARIIAMRRKGVFYRVISDKIGLTLGQIFTIVKKAKLKGRGK